MKEKNLSQQEMKKSAILQLKDVRKTYIAGDNKVEALKGVTLNFRKSEFVSVLGPSGCGKTTMLNIIGGLDRYSSGDMIIEGRHTTDFNDRDWDTYRNHRIGFIFQTYNLIPHQTVLSNVELALTISGVGKEERTKRAKVALEKVGLKGEEYKRPNQLSGGQCQRVAIARALVNEPDILLADEPTGALDSKTSVQIMELIKEISKDKLVIMVTHNGEIAEQYSTRIISLKDGEIVNDTNPFVVEEQLVEEPSVSVEKTIEKKKKPKEKRAKMSLWTAFKLSMRNLFTKKGRTALTAFAGSIGIIGISLILAVSQGATAYINHVQEATLSSYPITLESSSMDVMSLMESFMNSGKGDPDHPLDGIYKDQVIGELVDALAKANTGENDLASFKIYLDNEIAKEGSALNGAVSAVQYKYDLDLDVYTKYNDGNTTKIVKSDTKELLSKMLASFMLGSSQSGGGIGDISQEQSNSSFGMFSNMIMGNMWQELISSTDGGLVNDIVKEQYEKVYGEWPTQANEVVLVLNEHNELDDLTLYALGLIGDEEIDKIIKAAQNGETLEKDYKHWSYQELCQKEFKTILPYNCYKDPNEDGIWEDVRENPMELNTLYDNAYTIRISGIIRPNPESENHMISGAIGYTYKLTEEIIRGAENSPVVQAQKASPNIDVFTGKPFESSQNDLSDAQKSEKFHEYVDSLDELGKSRLMLKIKTTIPQEDLGQKVEEEFGKYSDDNNQAEKKQFLAEMYAQALKAQPEDVISMFENASKETIDGLVKMALTEKFKMEYTMEKIMPYIMADRTGELGYILRYAGLEEALEKIANDNATSLNTELSDLLNHQFGEEDELCAKYYQSLMDFSDSTYENNLVKMGCIDLGVPTSINIYASSFESKDVIVSAIDSYNSNVDETKKIKYTDYMGILMSSITTIIDAITYILIAFVAISLVVSSIMIAVITLISVQERTKEIGILRSIGASKKDVSSLFNAETLIIGLISGLLGVGVTYLLCIPINIILQTLTGIPTLRAILPIGAAAILVGISMLLNLISGIIPSRSAAKKDPVNALRTE